MSPLLVIAAGGTGGHMFPAQALAEEMLARGWRVMLSTDARGLRYADGFPREVTRRAALSATFARGGLLARLAVPFVIALGIVQAVIAMRRARPSAVIGFGGYPAIPALAAAWLLDLPRAIHEQNGVLGRVNRLFARRVHKVACGTWPLTNPPGGAACVAIGNPVRRAALTAAEAPYLARNPGEPARLLVFGGSQGASVFARLVPAAVAHLTPRTRAQLQVTQQIRPGDETAVASAYAEAGVSAEIAPFFDDLPDRIAAAHVVIARAGASTVAELSVIGRPAILVPYPDAMDDHQAANAAALSRAGGAVLMPERGLTDQSLGVSLGLLLADPARSAAMAEAARSTARPDAARALADLIAGLARPGAA